jgi:chemotaxis protein methyltransferase CheR
MSNDAPLSRADYEAISSLLYEWTGIRLQDKQLLVVGRLTPRLRALGLASFGLYVEKVKRAGRSSDEAQAFINQLTTNKTAFFRESHHFDFLRDYLVKTVMPRALRANSRKIRIWSAACSSGEEPYSLAMMLTDAAPSSAGWDVKILATDIDTEVLRVAKAGEYDLERLEGCSSSLRARFFTPMSERRLRVKSELSRLISFEQFNLVSDPARASEPFDAIFCRNVIIYFDQATQRRVVDRLVQRLTGDGRLFLGHSETLVGTDLERVSGQIGVYRRGNSTRVSVAPAPSRRHSERVVVRRVPSRLERVARAAHEEQQASDEASAARLPHKRIVLGQWEVATEPTIVSTLLGSCVSACLFDPDRGIGGMNHFMLPNCQGSNADPAHFGVHAMELLINGLLTRGAVRKNLRAKVFGAGAVTTQLPASVGDANALFVRTFLAKEGIPVMVERLGGQRPREVFFRTHTGEALVRTINPLKAKAVEIRELGAWQKPVAGPEPFDADNALF